MPRSKEPGAVPPLPHTSLWRRAELLVYVRERVVTSLYSCTVTNVPCACHERQVEGVCKEEKLFVSCLVVSALIVILKCNLSIITNIKLRRAQSICRKSNSECDGISRFTLGCSCFIFRAVFYSLPNYTICALCPCFGIFLQSFRNDTFNGAVHIYIYICTHTHTYAPT
jgi:hypothetical protein